MYGKQTREDEIRTPSVVKTVFAHQKPRGSEQLTSILWKRKKIRDSGNEHVQEHINEEVNGKTDLYTQIDQLYMIITSNVAQL